MWEEFHPENIFESCRMSINLLAYQYFTLYKKNLHIQTNWPSGLQISDFEIQVSTEQAFAKVTRGKTKKTEM
jgi:hypothetical protein